jgi:CheY-like chemotaxis protein
MAIETKFPDKSAKVLLVDSSGAVRQLLSEVAKAVGFTSAQAVASIADAHNILETDGADWVIVPLSADQAVNGLHTVRMVTSFYELRNVRVSLLLDESERWCLPQAFESGLLSFHAKPFTKDSLTKELEEFLSVFEKFNWDGTLLSAHYLRKHLLASQSAADLLALEKRLLELFPGNAPQLLNLAHAQHLSGKTDEAKCTLKQASFIDESLQAEIDAKAQELFGSTDLTPSTAEGDSAVGNVLGLNRVVIIDPEDHTTQEVKSIFEGLGVTTIDEYKDGEAAWQGIDAGDEPSLIITEWRVPNLTGPLLVQRIRGKGFLKCPIIVNSSLIAPSDMSIIREMGVANIVQKPVEKEAFIKTIVWTVQQDRMPTESQTLETKIRTMIGVKNLAEAENLSARYYIDESISEGRKNIIRAEIAFAKSQYEAARDFAIEGLKGAGDSIFALNILGKSLMILRQFEQALKCFQKAQNMSPVNLERLVAMAEGEAEKGDLEAANEALAQAKDIDPSSETVLEGAAKVAIASGSSDAAKKMLGQIEAIGNVISYLNNKAVAHAKCGLFDESMELYKKTLDSVPDDKVDVKATVTYNYALAKIRHNELADALVDLDSIVKLPENKITKKAQSLKKRLETAVASNTDFALNEGDHVPHGGSLHPESPTKDESQSADASTIAGAIVQTAAGDLCCYMIFKSLAPPTDDFKKLTATPPKFKLRKAIERMERFESGDAKKAG